MLPCLVAFSFPIFNALAAIINRSLKNLNDITVTTFINPSLMIVIMIIIAPLNMMYDALVENFRQYLLITQGVLDLAREEAEAELLG